MNQLKNLRTILFFASTLLIISCTKTIKEPTEEFKEEGVLNVVLNPNYLGVNKIDSAIAIWEASGTKEVIHFQVKGGQLSGNLKTVSTTGAGKMTIQLLSQVQVDGKPTQWETSFNTTVTRTTVINVNGPNSLQDAGWKPRTIINYDNTMGIRFHVIVALRPSDSYFEFKNVPPAFTKKVELTRSFRVRETGVTIASREWVCQTGCLDNTGSLTDRTYFNNLDDLLTGKEWNQYRITLRFYLHSNTNEIYEFGMVQNKE